MTAVARETRIAHIPQEVLDAAVSVVQTVAENERFRETVAQEEISRRVALGELIPTAKLQVAPGLELVPAGRLAQLDELAGAVVKAWWKVDKDSAWTDEEVRLSKALAALSAMFDDEDDPDSGGAEHSEVGPGENASPAATEPADDSSTQEVAPDDSDEPQDDAADDSSTQEVAPDADAPIAKPEGLPDLGDTGPCELCNKPIDDPDHPDQARLSWIIRRQKLCRPCLAGEAAKEDQRD